MKRSTLLLFTIGLFLTILSSTAVDAQDQDADVNIPEDTDDLFQDDVGVGDDNVNPEYEDTDYILLEDDYEAIGVDAQDVGGDDNADTNLDIRSVNSDDLLSLSDDVLLDDLEKRDWQYTCEQNECNARCLKLLNLPKGTCGFKGKCYCKRQSS